ncbi:MAG: septal ring lytic transglycosylase RlpA family protein, partial [Epsilonproteobacteria bacterium]|nr:septal ring lytic transglycosylase RlpA family protein [Campylobacterota bacterium]
MKLNNIVKALLLISISTTLFTSTLQAKDRNILAYKDRGIKYYPRYVKKGHVKIGKASWYGKPFHQRLTANGERYNMYNMTAAHRTYAMNTVLKVTNLDNKKSVKVRVNDRGPFYRSRDIDLSYGAAKKLGMTKKGIGRVKIEVISSSKKRSKIAKNTKRKPVTKQKAKTTTKKYTVQIASFFDPKSAKEFKSKQALKNIHIVKKYIPTKKRTAYRVVV